MSSDAVARIRELRSLIEAEAETTESSRTLSPKVADAFADAGLFHLMVPAEIGGMEADCDTIIDVLAEASYADGASGWSLMANINSTAYVAYIHPEAAREVVATKAGCAAGMFAPVGMAVKTDGGYSVQGKYQFGSGSGHSTYIGCGAIVLENGQPLPPHASGMPQTRCSFIPKENAVMMDGWDVMGLTGTGSYDYAVPEQVVDEKFSFDLFDAAPTTGGTLFHLGPIVLASICHTGWVLGVGRRAIDEIRDISNAGRARAGQAPVKEQQFFARPFAKHSLAIEAAEELNRKIYREIIATVESGQPMTHTMFERTRAASTYITEVCEEAVIWAYRNAGSKAFRNPSVLQRCMRDVSVGGRHMFVDAKNYEDLTKPLMAEG
ncbi:hypothetical protein EOPP23_08800 [Endozoicomonas sp. OPT23]|uniref:acyl-CoA dehydrogenase family protein n=1 Tax=Endozoicomonas sp. OPT23 TaxID=2072845 RepID=UPI00129AA6ED|nr:acyl-CoA dehydrogenase family protein [Endozoicomonas sp. OPT23]MRI33080.1 hypothetical protein [Endozoicomonas sp. OPT23]